MFNLEYILMSSYFLSILIAFITAVAGPFLVEWAKHKFFRKKHPNPLKEAFDLNDSVNTQLEDILHELKCDTVSILQFHNGGHFYPTGKSIQKFSVFYEQTTPRASSIARDLQNVPCSVFPKSLLSIYNNNSLSIPSFDGGYDIYDLDTFSVNYDTKSLYMFALKDLNNKLVAMLYIGYSENEHTLSADEVSYLSQKVGTIGTLLTKYLTR